MQLSRFLHREEALMSHAMKALDENKTAQEEVCTVHVHVHVLCKTTV